MPSDAASYLERSPIAFAHRGGAALWPENTLAAFQGAADLGYRYIETDAHMTRDGVIVLCHDESVDRTTDGHGRIADLTLRELSALDAGYRFTRDGSFPFRGQGLRIPTLEEALAIRPELRFNVEIKQREPAMERALCEVIDRCDAHDRLLVAAAHDPLVIRFRAMRKKRCPPTSPGIRGVVRFWAGVRTGLCRFDRYAFDALQVPVRWNGLTVVDRRFVEMAHAHRLHVHVWTIDDPSEMRRLLDLGVDGIMTDRPDLLKNVLVERGQWEKDSTS